MKLNQTAALIVAIIAYLGMTTVSHAQTRPLQLHEGETAEVLENVRELVLKNYVFPDVADQISSLLQRNIENGVYRGISSPQALAERLTKDIQSISHDRHLRVFFDPERVASIRARETEDPDPQDAIDHLRERQSKNFGFKSIEILGGNIGYIDLRYFDATDMVGDTVTAAMKFVENTDALIIDLRNNGGGSPSTVQLMLSYFLDGEPILLTKFYKRPENLTKQFWSLAHVPGKRIPETKLYILTSSSTFSAAEAFSYTLKHLDRATIVGEATGGGAHAGGREIATDRFLVWLPTAKSINPVTDANWEGTGVIPHVETKAKDALNKAYRMALETHIAEHPASSQLKEWYLQALVAETETVQLPEATLKRYAGKYGPRTLTFDSGQLYYQRGDSPKRRLTPIDETLFLVEGYDDFRIKVVLEGDDVVALQGISDNGRTSQNAKEVD